MPTPTQNQPAPADGFEVDRFLERILVPHAAKRRAEIYGDGKRPLARFSHYTSADAAIKIISQKRVWLRNATCMADYQEVWHGFTLLQRFFSDKTKHREFSEAIDSIASGAADRAIEVFNTWWTRGSLQLETFIGSVSEHGNDEDPQEDRDGRLSMWRAFGGNSPRVGLVFRIPYNSPPALRSGITFGPVAYFDDKHVERWLVEVAKNVLANRAYLQQLPGELVFQRLLLMLRNGVTCVKHPGFREEKEWRIVHSPQLAPSSLLLQLNEVVGGVPQIVYALRLDGVADEDLSFAALFDRLIIGPSQYHVPMFSAFVDALTKAGVPDAAERISMSRIPIRA